VQTFLFFYYHHKIKFQITVVVAIIQYMYKTYYDYVRQLFVYQVVDDTVH